jgi:hypothetical protein
MWVMEVLLGIPPPPPPPNVPTLGRTTDGKDGSTTRERMEILRVDLQVVPSSTWTIGLSLDNFGVTGKYRYREERDAARHAWQPVRQDQELWIGWVWIVDLAGESDGNTRSVSASRLRSTNRCVRSCGRRPVKLQDIVVHHRSRSQQRF